MKEFLESIELIEKAIHLYNRIENKKKDFGLGYEMTMKEIHTIQYIGDCPGINLKTLAAKQGGSLSNDYKVNAKKPCNKREGR